MNILITGGTGFVGKHLTQALQADKNHIYILTRSPENFEDTHNLTHINYDYPVHDLPQIKAVINLAGTSLFGRWTTEKKEAILKSRVDTTNKTIEFMKEMDKKPDVFISGSAIGFYGHSDDAIFTEATKKSGDDFLACVANAWEKTGIEAEYLGIRTVFTRFGVILGDGGALPLMTLPVKLFVGGPIGSGEQWLSWVHIDDVVGLIIHSLKNELTHGPLNVVSPNPKRNKDFMKTIAKVWKRPNVVPTPAFLMETALGEMSELITKGQFVRPEKALKEGYTFAFPFLEEALKDIKNNAKHK